LPSKNPPTPILFVKALLPSPNGVNERTSSIEPGTDANVPAATNPEPRAIGAPVLSRTGTAVLSAAATFKNETVYALAPENNPTVAKVAITVFFIIVILV
jgi:hypothetical protein